MTRLIRSVWLSSLPRRFLRLDLIHLALCRRNRIRGLNLALASTSLIGLARTIHANLTQATTLGGSIFGQSRCDDTGISGRHT